MPHWADLGWRIQLFQRTVVGASFDAHIQNGGAMNVDELLSLDRPLTDEEVKFLEQELLKRVGEFQLMSAELTKEIEEHDPEMAAQLRRHAASLKENVEKAVACDF